MEFYPSASSSSSGDEISDSELDTAVSKSLSSLVSGSTGLRVQNPDGSFRCPYCAGKKKQSFLYKDLLQHAAGIGASTSRNNSLKSSHRALASFLRSHFPDLSLLHPQISHPNPNPNPNPNPKISPNTDPNLSEEAKDEVFVWPWLGILVNAPIGETLEEKFSRFRPLEILPLFYQEPGPSHGKCSVILRFAKDWAGFKDAIAFENHLKASGFGKKEWAMGPTDMEGLYGWMGRSEDYNEGGLVGEYMRGNGELMLKTVAEVAEDATKENGKIVALLASQIEIKNQYLQEMETRYNQSDLSLKWMMEEKNKLHYAFNEGIFHDICCITSNP